MYCGVLNNMVIYPYVSFVCGYKIEYKLNRINSIYDTSLD